MTLGVRWVPAEEIVPKPCSFGCGRPSIGHLYESTGWGEELVVVADCDVCEEHADMVCPMWRDMQ